jgi:hypothetical protein
VAFAKPRKPGRNPLQRLSDQRRSVALAGLAVGAVLSAAIFRCKRRGVEDEVERPMPPAAVPPGQPESGPPAAVEVPPPAAPEPEVAATATAATATQADPEAPEAAAATSTSGTLNGAATATDPTADATDTVAGTNAAAADTEEDARAINTDVPAAEADAPASDEEEPTPVEPATGELSAEEASILAVLAQHGRSDDDRTAIAVATSLERETADVAGVLRKLGAEGVVAGELYTAAGDKIWTVTERGVRRLGAQH